MSVTYRELSYIGYPEYRVGNDGSVWTRKTRNGYRITDVWRRIDSPRENGYPSVNLSGDIWRVHILVLTVFVGPCLEGMECRHFPDRDKNNNQLTNLSWGTRSENREDQRYHGTLRGGNNRKGEEVNTAKLSKDQVLKIVELLRIGLTTYAVAKMFGLAQSTVWAIKAGKNWKSVLNNQMEMSSPAKAVRNIR